MSVNYFLLVEKNNGDSWEALDLYTKDGITNYLMLPHAVGRIFFHEDDESDNLIYLDCNNRGLPKNMSDSSIKLWGADDDSSFQYFTWYDYLEIIYLCNIKGFAAAAQQLKTIVDVVLDIYDIYAYLPNQVRVIIAQE